MEDILSLIAIALSLVSLIYSYKLNRDGVIHDRKRDTLDAFNLLQEQVLDQLNGYTKAELDRLCTNPQSAEYKKVSVLLARIEHFAVGVNEEIYDRKTVKRLAGRHIVKTYENLECMIEAKRLLSQKISGNSGETLYDDFEKLAVSLGYKKKANTARKTEDMSHV